ncbi:serine/arginine repetitive matrix protein 3-like [Grus americana]|uniref:serine/arginine repetitive matrix protein 3-like n=1 Tax=Grus americana TaxID=9117 RepID=UPI00240840BB|nr:serine/arginine repetitive matrix protein 3-like [Grus americana]
MRNTEEHGHVLQALLCHDDNPPGRPRRAPNPRPPPLPLRWPGYGGAARTRNLASPERAGESSESPSGPPHGPRERRSAGSRAASARGAAGQRAARGLARQRLRREPGARVAPQPSQALPAASGAAPPPGAADSRGRAAGGSHRAALQLLCRAGDRRCSLGRRPERVTQPSAAARGSSASHRLRRRADAKARGGRFQLGRGSWSSGWAAGHSPGAAAARATEPNLGSSLAPARTDRPRTPAAGAALSVAAPAPAGKCSPARERGCSPQSHGELQLPTAPSCLRCRNPRCASPTLLPCSLALAVTLAEEQQ